MDKNMEIRQTEKDNKDRGKKDKKIKEKMGDQELSVNFVCVLSCFIKGFLYGFY